MHSKGNHKLDEKTTLRMGENICKQSNQQGINLQNIHIAHPAQYQKKPNNPIKNGRKSKQTFLHRRYTDGQKAQEKMLNITNLLISTGENPLTATMIQHS